MVLKRIEKVRSFLRESGVDALLVLDPIDLFYLTSLKLSEGKLLITEKEATLFVDGRYLEAAKKKAPCTVRDSKLFAVKEKRVAFDALTTSTKEYFDLKKLIPDLAPFEGPVKKIRAIKDEDEIRLLKESAELCTKGFGELIGWLKEGVPEEELAANLEIFWKINGGQTVAFEPIIAFGPNSSQPHYRAGKRKLKRGDLILIDIGVMKESYASDMTRVLFFGEADSKTREVYSVVKEAQVRAIEECRTGNTLSHVDRTAREIISLAGYADFFTHGLGHGVGLEIHEWPTFKMDAILAPGMVITIEPGIYLPDHFGVRLEDTIVITEKGPVSLTKPALSKELPLITGLKV